MTITIREERSSDISAISVITEAAFRPMPYSSGTEHLIVDALRQRGELTISLVAVDNDDAVIGHVAISPVSISSGAEGWYGLGPIAVRPDRQGEGIGSALVLAALDALRQIDASGCILLGSPAYYGRFGFAAHPGLELPGVPADHFQALSLGGELPTGQVSYSEAFDVTA
ncbi:MAG TPA: N-acetyltransferase [Thermomicrobiales bacterium]|nr:N-acetyltransferase [Thermomicrobiales bacterium]